MKLRYILITGWIFLISSCADVLDVAPDGKTTLDDVFSNSEDAAAYLNSCYTYVPTKGVRYFFWSRGPVEWSDEAWDTDAEAEPWIMSGRMYNGDASASNHPITNISDEAGNGNYWDRYWAGIRKCSYFLQRIDKVPITSTGPGESHNRWKAEAHLLRAYYYSELLKWFGAQLPIQREPYSLDTDFSTLEKASYYEVAKFIIEDCDAALAIPDLPWRSTEPYRVTKALAEALKSRMILFAASPLNNDGQNYWDEAYQINKTSLANLRNHGYELYNKLHNSGTYQSDFSYFGSDNNMYAAIYNEFFTNHTDLFALNPIDKETIYVWKEGQGNIWDIDGIGAQDGYKSGTCPSQELIDSYETIDGQPILDLANPYLDEKHLQPNYNKNNALYDPQNPYANRDPRFYASIYYNGSKRKAFWGFAEVPESIENYPAPAGNRTRIVATWDGEPQTGIHRTKRSATRTGYYERKFLHPNSGNDNPIAGINFKLFRLGEVILNFAEAAVEAGYLDEAAAAVNEIRARVGMPPLPANLSKDELRLRVRHERRIELAMEEDRYFSVRRWCQPNGDLSKTDKWITAMEITRNADGTYSYKRRPVRDTERACYTNKFLWVPVPQGEADRLRAITGINWQNPGW